MQLNIFGGSNPLQSCIGCLGCLGCSGVLIAFFIFLSVTILAGMFAR